MLTDIKTFLAKPASARVPARDGGASSGPRAEVAQNLGRIHEVGMKAPASASNEGLAVLSFETFN